ncbi:hypothetical protein PRZ48_002532 [Zasmidium cellare]|uniref:Sulfatase N-terminal domain-containing protein n=1 Tax=Zasmidium cellare TaxID=395010 RepID=A0ABR0F7K3_ZASCE|nr:hypothetical protein PRZ48_002532 [Zasmidium cellare]
MRQQSVLVALASLTALALAATPNVIVIMADDQASDTLLDSMSVMPNVKSLIADKGITYERHYCTVSWCCPSRVNFLTGKAAHNTNVTGLEAPWGGWPKFVNQGLNKNYLPVWLNDAGIDTYYVGKFMNAYTTENFLKPAPKGWTDFSMLLEPGCYDFMHSIWNEGDKVVKKPGIHTQKITNEKTLQYLDDAAEARKPFFLMVAPVAPHVEITQSGVVNNPPPMPAQKGLFNDRIAPRRKNFNPDVSSGASWVANKRKLTEKEVKAGDAHHASRLRSIAGIDDMVKLIVDKLKDKKLLENTYIIYTSDNGYHISNHRLLPGKRCGYEEDISIPLLMTGPGIPQKRTSTIVSSHTDLAPTILKLFGVPQRPDFDGSVIEYTDSALKNSKRKEVVNVAFWDPDVAHENVEWKKSTPAQVYRNVWKSIRLQTAYGDFYYSVWCDGSKEFYDMDDDFAQMSNPLRTPLATTAYKKTYFSRPFAQLLTRLDTLLLITKTCKGDSCRHPWRVAFPGGKVNYLYDAMDEKYDRFFAEQPKVDFECVPGDIRERSGPEKVEVFVERGKRALGEREVRKLLPSFWRR